MYKLLCSVLVLVPLIECHYEVPNPSVEVLKPKGFKVSIPDEEGITLFAFHGNVNREMDGLEAGDMSKDILKKHKGKWTFVERKLKLKKGDTVYFWLFVIKDGLGYRLDDASFVYNDFKSGSHQGYHHKKVRREAVFDSEAQNYERHQDDGYYDQYYDDYYNYYYQHPPPPPPPYHRPRPPWSHRSFHRRGAPPGPPRHHPPPHHPPDFEDDYYYDRGHQHSRSFNPPPPFGRRSSGPPHFSRHPPGPPPFGRRPHGPPPHPRGPPPHRPPPPPPPPEDDYYAYTPGDEQVDTDKAKDPNTNWGSSSSSESDESSTGRKIDPPIDVRIG